MLFHGLLRFFRGGGMRPIAAVALFATLFVAVPSERTESNIVLASNADQPTSPGLNCSDRGITLSFTAPTQTSPTVTNYEYFVSLGALSAEPSASDAGWKTLSPADSTSPVHISRSTLGLTAATHPNVYYYYLRAVFSNGTKSLSWFQVVNGSETRTSNVGCSWMGPSIADSVPRAPSSLVATAGSGSASIAFNQGDTGTTEGITNYKYSLDGTTYTALSPADTTSPVTIPSLTPGVTYTIAVPVGAMAET